MYFMLSSYYHIGKSQNMAPTSHSPHWNLSEQKRNMKLTNSLINKVLPQEDSTWFIGKVILMPNRHGNWSQTWAMLWQCSMSIETDEDYDPPHDSTPPIAPPHPLPHLSSPHPSLPPSPIFRTWHSKTCSRTLLLLPHYLLPLSLWLLNPWWHPSSHGWTIYLHLPVISYMPPSSKAPWPTRHSRPYSTSLPITLSSSLLSFSRFIQPFAPFHQGYLVLGRCP